MSLFRPLWGVLPPSWRRVSLAERRVFASLLRVQLDAGLDLSVALRSFAQRGSPGLESVGRIMAQRIDEGSTVAQAADAVPELFTPYERILMDIGERSGSLVEVLRAIEEAAGWLAELRRKTLGALVYPAILVNVAYLCGNVMMLMDGAIAAYLLGWVLLDVVLAAASIGLGWALEREPLRVALDRLLLNTPGLSRLLGTPLTHYHQALFFAALGRSLEVGVDLPVALGLAVCSVECEPIRRDLAPIVEGLQRGEPLGASALKCRFLTPAQQTTIDVAESAGGLPSALMVLARDAREELERWLSIYQRVLPVVLLLLMTVYVLARGM